MEKWNVVGYRVVNFKDQRTNRDVNGFTLFLERQPETDKILGVECQKIFNRYGKVLSIEVC